MSRYRATALRLLERTYKFPKALRLRDIWADLDDVELDALVRLRLDIRGPEPRLLMVQEVVEAVEDALATPAHPIHQWSPEQTQDHCKWLLAQGPDERLRMTAAILMAASRKRAKVSASARKNASGPRAKNQARMKPYLDIHIHMLRSGAFPTNQAYAAEYKRRESRALLEPVSAKTRAAHKRRAKELLP